MSVHPPLPRATAQRVLALLFTLLFIAYAYTFLHEGGHALLGLLFGGRLTSFSVDFITFKAHAGIDGQFAPWQRAVISAAGVGLPLSLWTLFLGTRRQLPQDNPVVTWLLFVGSIGVYSTLLAWIILPLLTLSGVVASDDAVNFLHVTGAPPLLVSAAALAAYAGGLALFFHKAGGLGGLRARLKAASVTTELEPAALAALRGMAAVLALLVGATFAVQALAGPGAGGGAPAGYTPAFEVSLAERGMQAEAVYRFTLDEAAEAGFYFVLREFEGAPIELALSGPQGVVFTFLRFTERAEIGRATVQPEPLALPAGAYEVLLTAPRGESTLEGYVKIEAQK